MSTITFAENTIPTRDRARITGLIAFIGSLVLFMTTAGVAFYLPIMFDAKESDAWALGIMVLFIQVGNALTWGVPVWITAVMSFRRPGDHRWAGWAFVIMMLSLVGCAVGENFTTLNNM